MTKFESWLVNMFAYHLTLLRTDRMSDENVEITVKLLGMITATFPLVLFYWVTFTLLMARFTWESMRPLFVLLAVVTVFGGSTLTDKIFLRNVDKIERLAKKMKQNSAGVWFAAKCLLKFHLMASAIAFGTYVAIKGFV